jgi:hypothetical protein
MIPTSVTQNAQNQNNKQWHVFFFRKNVPFLAIRWVFLQA